MDKRILIVVDEKATARWLPGHFSDGGWRVSAASGGEQALAAIERDGIPDAAVIDAVLGDGDGFALIEDVRRIAPGAQIVCTSARAGNVARLKALAAGADAYLPKPFRLADLDRLLERDGGPE